MIYGTFDLWPKILTLEKTQDSLVFFVHLIYAARKAVSFGYRVFILPNPKGIRTADYIFERKGVYKIFDLKTIIGRNSVGNRLKESMGQTNSVLLNLKCSYLKMMMNRFRK